MEGINSIFELKLKKRREIQACPLKKTTSEERLDQLGMHGFNPKNVKNVYRGLFPAEKDKLSCKEALDMGEDFARSTTFEYGALEDHWSSAFFI